METHNFSRFMSAFGMILLLLTVQMTCTDAAWFGWFGRGKKGKGEESQRWKSGQKHSSAVAIHPFDIESQDVLRGGVRGKELYERSIQLQAAHSCWQEAYTAIESSCREILKDDAKKSRMAFRLTNCFLKTSGRPLLKDCPDKRPIATCVKEMNDHNHGVFLAFYMDSAAMCHYLQSQEFKQETEHLVNELKVTAHYTEDKLGSMSEQLEEQHRAILRRSEQILDAQKKLQMEHALLQESVHASMGSLQKAADEAEEKLDLVNKYQKDIGEKQHALVESLHSEVSSLQQLSDDTLNTMTNLHGSVDDLAEKSLTGQEEAMRGLSELQRLQLEAMEESKQGVNTLVEEAQQRQEEFRGWQVELDDMHHLLIDGTTNMIQAQEEFVAKQAHIFTTMDRLFSLHNTILLESRAVKTLMLYFALSLFVYMATTTKQTHNARVLLYFGLFVTFTFEVWLIRHKMEKLNTSSMKLLSWPPKKIVWVRYAYGFVSLLYLVYAFFSYRDYEYLTYKMLKEMYGRFGEQSKIQEKLLAEYLDRCEICKDLPQPNGKRPIESSHDESYGDESDEDESSHFYSASENVESTSHQKKATKSVSASRIKPKARASRSPRPRPRRKAVS